jgi:hypothetical protein
MPAPIIVAARTAAAVVLASFAALTGGALAGATLAGGPARAAPSDVFVEVNPNTIEAGKRVGIRASCPDNSRSATVRSDAFGRVTVEPKFGFLARSVTIPDNQDPRSFTVRLSCPGGQTATSTLHVVDRTRPSRGPATGFGGTADEGAGGALVAVGLLTIAAGLAVGLLTLGRRRAAR